MNRFDAFRILDSWRIDLPYPLGEGSGMRAWCDTKCLSVSAREMIALIKRHHLSHTHFPKLRCASGPHPQPSPKGRGRKNVFKLCRSSGASTTKIKLFN